MLLRFAIQPCQQGCTLTAVDAVIYLNMTVVLGFFSLIDSNSVNLYVSPIDSQSALVAWTGG
jgi:hypothetical protein